MMKPSHRFSISYTQFTIKYLLCSAHQHEKYVENAYFFLTKKSKFNRIEPWLIAIYAALYNTEYRNYHTFHNGVTISVFFWHMGMTCTNGIRPLPCAAAGDKIIIRRLSLWLARSFRAGSGALSVKTSV